MFKKIYVPVDNSEYSNKAIEMALALAKPWNATIVGSHVYAAKMHDYRFKQMEYTLPEEYQDETELARQRKIHDSLITMGLQLISDSYLDVLQARCQEAGLAPAWPRWLNAWDLSAATIHRGVELECQAISVDFHRIDHGSLAAVRAAGLDVAAWTVRRRTTYGRLQRLGVIAACVEAAALDG